MIIKQSTARTVTVGPILDSDGVAVTGAVVGDLKISKNGAAPSALNGSATLTHRNTGHYSLALTASDTDTVGSAEIVIDKTTDAMPTKTITIVEEAIYDALFASGATAPATATALATAQSDLDIITGADGVVVASGTQTFNIAGNITGNLSGSVGSVTGNVGGNVVGSVASVTGAINTAAGTITTLDGLDTAQDTQHAATLTRLGTPAGADVSADIAAVKAETALIVADTNELQTDLTNGGRLDLILDATLADTNELQTDWANGGRLDLILDAATAPSAAAVADAVWDEARAGHTTAGTFGFYLDAAVSSISGTAGSGSLSTPVTIEDGASSPLADAQAWVTTSATGQPVVAGTLVTDSNGSVTFLLDASTQYYLYAQKNGRRSIVASPFYVTDDGDGTGTVVEGTL